MIPWTLQKLNSFLGWIFWQKCKKKKSSKGHNSETKKEGTIILLHSTLTWPKSHSYKISWRYAKQLPSYGVYKKWKLHKMSIKNNQRAITLKRKNYHNYIDTSFWPDTHSYKVSWRYLTVTKLWRILDIFYDFQRGITQKLRKGEQSFLCGTLCLDQIYISVISWKYLEDCLQADSHAIMWQFFSKLAY